MHTTITNYIEASNGRDVDAQVGCFTQDAVVEDDNRTHRGVDQIRAWILENQAAFEAHLDVSEVEEEEKETVVTGIVSGSFDGSPITLRFFFTLEGEKIAALSIRD